MPNNLGQVLLNLSQGVPDGDGGAFHHVGQRGKADVMRVETIK